MIIGLIGRKRVGKDTIADYLVKNYKFVKYGFGEPLKEVCKTMFDLSPAQLETDLKDEIDERWNIRPRDMFQILGTDFAREMIHQKLPQLKVEEGQFWVHKFGMWYQERSNSRIVISDIRFVNEYEYLKKLGAVFIKINRNVDNIDTHRSEQEIDLIREIDYTINNNSNLEELYYKINNIIKHDISMSRTIFSSNSNAE